MDDLYRQQIIDRYKRPLKRGVLEPHDLSYEDENPLCGDRLRIDLRVGPDGRITQAAFSGDGCAISIASADLLLESIEGKPLEEVRKLSKEDVLGLLGINLNPVRLKCALLSLKVLKAGAYGIKEEELDET
jgi:nitrogen fixation NifU-like protein